MRESSESTAPVAVGGLGGSGTRVVARLLIELGVYLGDDLNESLDNLWFTLLFKRRRWLQRRRPGDRAIRRGFAVFEKAMRGTRPFNLADIAFVASAATEMSLTGHDHLKADRGAWPWVRARKLLTRQRRSGRAGPWGWKEPNTHIYLADLAQALPGSRYIHVLRNGLDMAYSANQAQLFNWGWRFGVDSPQTPEERPKAALEYWIRSTRAALAEAERCFGSRFLAIRFEDLCEAPRPQLERMIGFLQMDGGRIDLNQLTALVERPNTIGRHREHALDPFDDGQLQAVESLGFAIR